MPCFDVDVGAPIHQLLDCCEILTKHRKVKRRSPFFTTEIVQVFSVLNIHNMLKPIHSAIFVEIADPYFIFVCFWLSGAVNVEDLVREMIKNDCRYYFRIISDKVARKSAVVLQMLRYTIFLQNIRVCSYLSWGVLYLP